MGLDTPACRTYKDPPSHAGSILPMRPVTRDPPTNQRARSFDMAQTPFSDRVKWFFGIDPDEKLDDGALLDDGSYLETEPTTKEFLYSLFPTLEGITAYLHSLFPFVGWIFHYNLTWLLGDFIAGRFGERPVPRPSAKIGN